MAKKDIFIYNTAMYNIFSTAASPSKNINAKLLTIYYVRADKSYDVSYSYNDPDAVILFRTISGTGRINFKDSPPIEVNADTVIISNNSNIERYRCRSENWNFWWFKCKVDKKIDLPYYSVIDLPGAVNEEYHTTQCFELLRDDLKSASVYASAHMGLLLAKWIWQWHCGQRSGNPHQSSISKVVKRMHNMLDKRFTVEMMADTACLGIRRFRQVFELETGLSPKRYFDKLRLDTAAEMLQTTGFSISQLAEKLGYSSQFHFSKAFKSHFGISPMYYKK